MIGNRSAGGIFEDRKILQYIQKKKDKDAKSPRPSPKQSKVEYRVKDDPSEAK